MDARERRAWLTLLLAPGVGPAAGMRLLQAFGGAATALDAGRAAWRAAGVPDALHDGLRKPDADAMRNAEAWLDGVTTFDGGDATAALKGALGL